MNAHLPRPLRGIFRGSRNDGVLSLEFVGSAVALHAAPIWALDVMLELPELLGPGLYLLIGTDDPEQRPRAFVGEGGMMRERLASHANDPRLEFAYEVLAVTGPRVLNETIRLYLQRRFVDEVLHNGRIGRVEGHDPERFTASAYDIAAAGRLMTDLRPLFGLVFPGLIADVEPVVEPITARVAALPRGVDPDGANWSTHEMSYAGARATASMLGRETVLLPGSTVIAASRSTRKWLLRRKRELLASGVLAPHGDTRLLVLTAFVRFGSANEATCFVTGGAAASARLTWLPVDDP